MSLAFIPVYINYLGIDALGLIGLFALLQAWLVVYDMAVKNNTSEISDLLIMGARPEVYELSLKPEQLELSCGQHDAQIKVARPHKIAINVIVIVSGVALGIWAASSWLALVCYTSDWLIIKNLPVETIAQVFTMMGAVTALQYIESNFTSSHSGSAPRAFNKLQRPTLQNLVTIFMATVRSLGALGVLAWVSHDIKVFFIWQVLVSLVTVALFAGIFYDKQPAQNEFLTKNVVSNNFAAGKPHFSRYCRLAKEGSWILVGQIISVAASLVLVHVLTDHLNPAQYGQLALALTLGTLITQVAFSGSMPGIMRYYAIAAEKGGASEYFLAVRRTMGYSTLVALGLSALLLIALPLFGKADMLGLTGMTIIFTLLGSYNGTQNMIQNAARQRQVVMLHGSLEAWMKVLFAAGMLTWLGNSAKTVVAAYIASLLLVLISQSIFIRGLIPKYTIIHKPKPNPWAAQIWKYSKPFVFFNTFTWLQASSDRWALDTFSTTQDVGLYAVLIQLGYTPITMVAGLMTTLIGPILFQRSGDTTDPSRNVGVHKSAWQITAIAIFSTLFACLFTDLYHEWIFRLLVAPQYRTVSYLLPWMILAGGLFSAGQVLGLKLMSDLNTQSLVWPKIVTSLLGALLSFAGAYFGGLKGVVYGAVTFSVLQLLWLSWISWHPIDTQNKEL